MAIFSYIVLLTSAVNAYNWFSHSEPEYVKWSHTELRTWLEHQNIKTPSSFDKPHLYDLVDANWNNPLFAYAESGRQWPFEQYSRARRTFEHIKDDSFDKWDDSRLRSFLLEQGIVAPSGPHEQLVLLAKSKYRAYNDAAAYYSSLVSASSSAYADASDAAYSASQHVSDVAAQATHEVARAIDETKDYVWSTWDDSHLREWLQERGIVEAKSANTRAQLLRLVRNYYHKASSAVWESWSDLYIREWLIAHNLLEPTDTFSRSTLLGEMKKYYYNCADKVWSAWTDSELKGWLVDHGFLKSDAKNKRDELVSMVEKHYHSALDSVWGAWSDSDICQWLSEHGYLESKSEIKSRKDLIDIINTRYPDASSKVAPYLVWPDTRLRAYLRERGMNEDVLPANRVGLLQEVRIHWVQASRRVESVFTSFKEIISSSVEAVGQKVARALEILSGHSRDAAHFTSEDPDGVKTSESAQHWGWHKANQAKEWADEEGSKERYWGGGEL